MLYFITVRWKEEWRKDWEFEIAKFRANTLHPLLVSLARLSETKRISGGVADQQAIFIVNAESRDEVFKMLSQLPRWGLFKWEVILLKSFQTAESDHLSTVQHASPLSPMVHA